MSRLRALVRRFVDRAAARRSRDIERLAAQVAQRREALLRACSSDAFAIGAAELGPEASQPPDALLVGRLALACEAARRSLGLDPYDTQVRAALVLHRGRIAQMETGEGKTLAAALAASVDAASGRRVHVATANDYLARRDAGWMAPLYALLGLRAACRQQGQGHDERRDAHACDIVYGTAAELSFDFLMDGFRPDADSVVCRGFDVAIIDEADHILLDEATNPLVVTADVAPDETAYRAVAELAASLAPGDIEIAHDTGAVTLSESGIEAAESWLGARGLIVEGGLFAQPNLETANRIWQALRAHHAMKRDVHYILRDNAVLVLDQRTGRTTRGRFAEGLHQAIEAMAGLPLSPEQRPLASVTMRAFARLYAKCAGTTATAIDDADELAEVYGLEVVAIAPRLASRRVDHEDQIFGTAAERLDAVVALVRERHASGQPILVGTTGVPMSDELSVRLNGCGIAHMVLHAHFDAREADIVAQAGRRGAVTVATNMAGRGTDIELGASPGAARGAERAAVAAAGGLLVIGVQRQALRRLDKQLRGRAGRQGDPGESVFLLSLEDTLFDALPAEAKARLVERAPRAQDGRLLGEPLMRLAAAIQDARRAAGYAQRKSERAYGEILDRQREAWAALREDLLLPRAPGDAAIARVLAAAARFAGLDGAASGMPAAIEPAVASPGCRRLIEVLDAGWRVHLAALDSVRAAIGLRAFAERDPLSEYRVEALAGFERMLAGARSEFAAVLASLDRPPRRDPP